MISEEVINIVGKEHPLDALPFTGGHGSILGFPNFKSAAEAEVRRSNLPGTCSTTEYVFTQFDEVLVSPVSEKKFLCFASHHFWTLQCGAVSPGGRLTNGGISSEGLGHAWFDSLGRGLS